MAKKSPKFPRPDFIKDILKERKIKLQHLSERTKYGKTYLSAIINGQRKSTDEMLSKMLIFGFDFAPSKAEETIRKWRIDLLSTAKDVFKRNYIFKIMISGKDTKDTDYCIFMRKKGHELTYEVSVSLIDGKIQRIRIFKLDDSIEELKEQTFLQEIGVENIIFWDTIMDETKFSISSESLLSERGKVMINKPLIKNLIEAINKLQKRPISDQTLRHILSLSQALDHECSDFKNTYKTLENAITLYLRKYA